MRASSVGVYVHLPFCERVCPYCDFAVVAARPLEEATEERYVAALERELAQSAPTFAGLDLVSVYFGGGTPSLLRPQLLERILGAVRARFPAPGEPEITLEVNPSRLERDRLSGFRGLGVNRLSIGIQSFDDEVLQRLGRAHKAEDSHQTLDVARHAGFDNISLDLICTAPGHSADRLERDLDQVEAFAPEHVSAYELTIEEGTPFALAAARGQLRLPGDDQAAEMLERVEQRLEAAGLERYELLSYARPGREARHNTRYWQRAPVLGIGMGAWTNEPASLAAPHGRRCANVRGYEEYLERVEGGELPRAQEEALDPRSARAEAVFLGLRRKVGVDASSFEEEFGAPLRDFFDAQIDSLVADGLLEEAPSGDLRLTSRGRLFADGVGAHFV